MTVRPHRVTNTPLPSLRPDILYHSQGCPLFLLLPRSPPKRTLDSLQLLRIRHGKRNLSLGLKRRRRGRIRNSHSLGREDGRSDSDSRRQRDGRLGRRRLCVVALRRDACCWWRITLPY